MDDRPKVPLGRMHIDDEMPRRPFASSTQATGSRGQNRRPSAKSGRSTAERLEAFHAATDPWP